jgi:predicted outer membrane repeat protein
MLVLAGVSLRAASYIYVDASATSVVKDGTSWANAYTDLQSALAVAMSGDTVCVAQGTYKPTSDTDRTISFQLKSGVQLRGGYPSGGGTRNPAFKTILSGDIGIPGDKSDNSLHVVNGNGVDYTAVMDGFTITAGNADNSSGPWEDDVGGGMFIHSIGYTDGNPTLTNVTFSDNSASSQGGGLYAYYSSLTLTDVTFTGNTSGYDGGAIFLSYGGATLTNVTISGNSAGRVGGGICVKDNAAPILTHVTISGNTASGINSPNNEYGGGWYFNADNDSCPAPNDSCNAPMVRNSILWGNSPNQLDNNRGNAYFSDSVVQDGCLDSSYLHCANIIVADPKLGTLGDNGGYTQTIPLLAGSSAIDTGLDYGVTTDQRGVVRPQGMGYDIGAYEYVPDTVPPVVTVPANKTVDATGPGGAIVMFTASAVDDVDGPLPVTCTPASGSTFPVGVTTVTCTATDASGNVGSASFTVTVRYTSPITIVSLTPTPASLWPPNHKMVNVIVAVRTSGGVGVTTCQITGATSSEPDSGLGDGDTAGDIGAGNGLAISLRAERSGNGPGRIYTLTVSCSGAAGTSAKTTTVTVPHDQGKK